jgi:hypothetical protein
MENCKQFVQGTYSFVLQHKKTKKFFKGIPNLTNRNFPIYSEDFFRPVFWGNIEYAKKFYQGTDIVSYFNEFGRATSTENKNYNIIDDIIKNINLVRIETQTSICSSIVDNADLATSLKISEFYSNIGFYNFSNLFSSYFSFNKKNQIHQYLSSWHFNKTEPNVFLCSFNIEMLQNEIKQLYSEPELIMMYPELRDKLNINYELMVLPIPSLIKGLAKKLKFKGKFKVLDVLILTEAYDVVKMKMMFPKINFNALDVAAIKNKYKKQK